MMPYDDLKEAIQAQALNRRRDGAVIIASEQTGEHAEWIFDMRAILLQPKWLNRYAELFWERYASHYPFQVGGMEMAGVPLVAAIVMKGVERGTPVNGFFIRKSRKREGLMKAVEGTLTDEPIILVDDLINSGNTFNKQIAVLAQMGKRVSDIFALVAFRERSGYAFAAGQGVGLHTLFTLQDFGLTYVPHRHGEPEQSFTVRWRFGAPQPSFNHVVQKSSPAVGEGRVFVGSDHGVFFALSQESGEVLWRFAVGPHPRGKGIFSSPVLHRGVVYFGAYDGNVYALDAATGRKRWVNSDAEWVGSSPAIAPDLGLLYIGLEYGLLGKRGGIAALSMESGAVVWKHVTREHTHGSPLYIPEEQLVVVGSNDGAAYGYDAKTGTLRWRYLSGSDIKMSFAYDPKRRTVAFGSMDSKCYLLSAEDGAPLFGYNTGAGIYSTPLVDGNLLYVASLDKNLYAIDLDTWKPAWTFSTRGRIFSSPTLHEGSLWLGSNDGILYELDPQTGKARHTFQLPERVIGKVAYDAKSKQFFVLTVANEVYCLERKGSDLQKEVGEPNTNKSRTSTL